MGRFTLDDGQSKAVGNPQAKAPIAFVDKSTADHILQKANTSIAQFKAAVNQTLMPASTNISISLRASVGVITERFNDPNVLGLIEGSDLKDEIVVVCGHYDHDGILPDGTFFPGADDNGSGTVAVLELARAFAKAKENGNGPRRSILFMGLAAEERGLLGSQYYTENPILPLENTVACINIDMIGRIDDLHLNGDHNYIHVIGVNKLSTDLKPIVEAANKDILINLDYSYDRPNEPMRLYYRSDHYNFAKNGIPALFFFSGLHPHYHTPEDTVDKIDFPMMVKREHLIFKTVWDIADRDERLKVDIPE
jgi:Zn-dependent M28 family amino/carboxypeptidase